MKDEVSIIIDRLADEFLKFLQTQFQDDEIYEVLKPLIPAILDLAKTEGIEAAEVTIKGLMSDNSYEHWQVLIKAASYEHRLLIMEQACQQGIQDGLRKIEQDERKKQWFGIALKVLFVVLPVLL